MAHRHSFIPKITWTGNTGQGNKTYLGYKRTWEIQTPGKPVVQCSNDPMLGGDPTLHNPEDILISALSSCHMLWFLHLSFDAGILVTAYSDTPEGIGESEPSGAGRFFEAILRPEITLAAGQDPMIADKAHGEIHKYCFIANSVNFPVTIEATYQFES